MLALVDPFDENAVLLVEVEAANLVEVEVGPLVIGQETDALDDKMVVADPIDKRMVEQGDMTMVADLNLLERPWWTKVGMRFEAGCSPRREGRREGSDASGSESHRSLRGHQPSSRRSSNGQQSLSGHQSNLLALADPQAMDPRRATMDPRGGAPSILHWWWNRTPQWQC